MKKNIVLGITGGIAAYKACEMIRLFTKAEYNVNCIMTKHAQEFITPLSIETLSKNKVITDMFALPESRDPVHISIAQKADVIVIAPASCNFLGKLRAGICDDMLLTTVMASKAPVLIAPAMNTNMYDNPITQENIEKLTDLGYNFIGPEKGMLACGTYSNGHIADVKKIFDKTRELAN
jgi:phosphopantothenoylcysteine decarboxylase/phosphopantothenate--cysteine ligase